MRPPCGEGFVAFAPDLYNGKIARTIPEAEVLRDEMDGNPDQASATVAAAAAYLSAHPAATDRRLAVMGFSLGAYFALELSVSDPERVRSVVVFYGTRPANDYAETQTAYLGHFSQEDDFEPPEVVRDMEQSLRQAGRPVTFYTYPNTGHWFFEPTRRCLQPAAADLAWQRTWISSKRTSFLNIPPTPSSKPCFCSARSMRSNSFFGR